MGICNCCFSARASGSHLTRGFTATVPLPALPSPVLTTPRSSCLALFWFKEGPDSAARPCLIQIYRPKTFGTRPGGGGAPEVIFAIFFADRSTDRAISGSEFAFFLERAVVRQLLFWPAVPTQHKATQFAVASAGRAGHTAKRPRLCR